jgi:hypothetical protein
LPHIAATLNNALKAMPAASSIQPGPSFFSAFHAPRQTPGLYKGSVDMTKPVIRVGLIGCGTVGEACAGSGRGTVKAMVKQAMVR